VAEEHEPRYRVTPLADQVEQRGKYIHECLRVVRPSGILYIRSRAECFRKA
jgi:hypothetical protein